jgi:hypothetical protein
MSFYYSITRIDGVWYYPLIYKSRTHHCRPGCSPAIIRDVEFQSSYTDFDLGDEEEVKKPSTVYYQSTIKPLQIQPLRKTTHHHNSKNVRSSRTRTQNKTVK